MRKVMSYQTVRDRSGLAAPQYCQVWERTKGRLTGIARCIAPNNLVKRLRTSNNPGVAKCFLGCLPNAAPSNIWSRAMNEPITSTNKADRELDAIGTILGALDGLDGDSIQRVLDY